MRVIRFLDGNAIPTYGAQPAPDGPAERLEGDPFTGLHPTGRTAEVGQLLAPIKPTAILCIGLNYRKHAEESGAELPTHPVLFMKNPATACGPGDAITIPPLCADPPQVDYEVELAVVIGRAARDVQAADALDHVLGYTVANDVSARTWQKQDGAGQWVRGKSFDTFCPLGPALVTTDEIPDPQQLDLTTHLNGRKVQGSSTADMIFPVAELIAQLSQGMTLLPGTLLLTGTPSGVGASRTPPLFLKPGDTVCVACDQIGALSNPVTAG